MLIDFRAAVGALSSIVGSLRSIYITKHAAIAVPFSACLRMRMVASSL